MKHVLKITLFGLGLVILSSATASAVSGSDWKAGRIIDDAIFTDKSSMTVAQVQQFLDSKIPECDTHGEGTVTYDYPKGSNNYVTTSRALYSYRRSNGAVTATKPDNIPDADHQWYIDNTWFRCINEYWENPDTGANNYANRPKPTGSKSAANLIWDAAQTYNISPKVLLVTLQKEQSMVTDTYPFLNQYLYAMGAYCPDGPNGADCNPAYAGFGKQIKESARLFRYYLDNMFQPWWSNKKPGDNFILWQVTSHNCGGSNVYIENTATAALYTYTPYQPNQSALDNLYGEGDYCSAYGNRNFWRMFHDWFGTTYADGYVAQFNAQSSMTAPFYPGEPKTVYIQYKNLGSARWYDDASAPAGVSPVHLAASVPTNRSSVFSYGWPSDGRPNFKFTKVYKSDGKTLAANQHVVEPGQIARFEFTITPPWNINVGTHREHFQPVLEGASNWNMGGLAWLDVKVASRYKAEFRKQSAYPTLLQNDGTKGAYIEYKNAGSAAWYDKTSKPPGYYPVELITEAPRSRRSSFGATWPSRTKAAIEFSKVYKADGKTLASNQHIVMPGEIARFELDFSASFSVAPGTYREYFRPWLTGSYQPNMGAVSWWDITVKSSENIAYFHKQSAFPTIKRGKSVPAFIEYRNGGSARWYDDASAPAGVSPVHLAASVPTNRSSVFSYGWPSDGRPNFKFTKVYKSDGKTLAANQHVVEPGQIARFEFTITPPWNINVGTHREHFQPVLEGASNWNMGGLAWLDVKVTN